MQSKHNQPDISYEKKILAGVRETVQNKSRNKHSTENFSCDISFCSLWIPATITIRLFVCLFFPVCSTAVILKEVVWFIAIS